MDLSGSRAWTKHNKARKKIWIPAQDKDDGSCSLDGTKTTRRKMNGCEIVLEFRVMLTEFSTGLPTSTNKEKAVCHGICVNAWCTPKKVHPWPSVWAHMGFMSPVDTIDAVLFVAYSSTIQTPSPEQCTNPKR